jgi:hypothetical protein
MILPRREALLEKLTVLKLVRDLTELYATRKFITVFKPACHLSQVNPLHPLAS